MKFSLPIAFAAILFSLVGIKASRFSRFNPRSKLSDQQHQDGRHKFSPRSLISNNQTTSRTVNDNGNGDKKNQEGLNDDDDFAWLECHEFVSHLTTLTDYLHIQSIKKIPGYSRQVCKELLGAYQRNAPQRIDLIVNLSHHLRQGGKIHPDAKMENYAKRMRRRYARQRQLQIGVIDALFPDPSGCDGNAADSPPNGAVYQMSFPGPGAATSAHPIVDQSTSFCPDQMCPTVVDVLTQPKTCIPPELEPDYSDDAYQAFEEFRPGYGGGFGYRAYTASIIINDPAAGPVWAGCDQDRVGDYDSLAKEFKVAYEIDISVLAFDITCEFIDSGFEIGFFGIAVVFPNPIKIACVAVLTALKITQLTLETIQDQIDFQNGLVDGAEIQAGYYHSINLLDKQCSSFYEAVCRCSETGIMGAPGVGCDGLDSNCDGQPDDCGEDAWPPEIDTSAAVDACGVKTGKWFETVEDARACVEASLIGKVADDCNGVPNGPVVSNQFVSDLSCSQTTLSVEATDGCGNSAPSETITVAVDDGAGPLVSCTVGDGGEEMVLGPGKSDGHYVDVNLQYEAQDGCGLSDVKVEVFSNEFERGNDQAILYKMDNDQYRLFVDNGNCGNGICIQDPALPDIRVYYIQVSATDNVGKSTSTECRVRVIQKGNGKNTDISGSVQRFPVIDWSPSVVA